MFNKINGNRQQIAESGVATIAYLQRLSLGETTSEHATAVTVAWEKSTLFPVNGGSTLLFITEEVEGGYALHFL